MFAAWFQTFAHADTIEVGVDEPTITAALEAAASGDEILVPAGTYDEDLFVEDLALTLTGVGGPVLTTSEFDEPILTILGGAEVTVRGFTFDRDDRFGSALALSGGAVVLLEDVAVVGERDRPGPDVFAQNVGLTLIRASFDGGTGFDGAGGHLQAIRSDLVIEDSTFVEGQAELGGALFVSDSDLVVRRSTFTGNLAGLGGAILAADGGAVTVEDCLFERNIGLPGYGYDGFGGAIHQIDGTLVISGSTFRENEAEIAGAVEYSGPSLTVTGSLFEGNAAGLDSAVALDAVQSATITGSTFRDNVSDLAGAISAYSSTTDLEIAGNRFCDDRSDDRGGAISIEAEDRGSTASIHHNLFVGTSAGGAGGAIRVGAGTAEIVQNTIVETTSGLGAIAVERGGQIDVVNNAIVAAEGGGIFVEDGSSLAADHNLYFEADLIGADFGAGDVRSAPGFVEASPYACEATFVPAAGSALIDAGDPARLDDDGSRSDIGATGGIGATALVDVDGDGLIGAADCAPYDPSTACGADPGALDGAVTGLPPSWFCAHGGSAGAWWVALLGLVPRRRTNRNP